MSSFNDFAVQSIHRLSACFHFNVNFKPISLKKSAFHFEEIILSINISPLPIFEQRKRFFMVMGSKKIEVVVDAIHLFIKEMNQVIDNARSMRNELQKYRELLSDKIGPEFMEGDYKEFGDEDEDQNASSSANALLQTRKKRSHREGSLGIPIPPSVSEELAETHSAFERSTYLKEQFNETSGSLSNSKEIAAALFPVGSQSFSDTSAEEKADLVAETALKTGKSLTPTPKIALTEDWNTKKKAKCNKTEKP